MATTGTATLDFGAFPGSSHATIAVTGQAAIVAGSLVEAWIRPVATADHTADEHMVETLKVVASDIVAGTGFTIHGFNTNGQTEPVQLVPHNTSLVTASATTINIKTAEPGRTGNLGGKGTMLYGQWTVAWVWN
ncbi:MAG: hypothetical protein M3R04_06980 [bacterium]|nr:hypothetical protein [bacterium]